MAILEATLLQTYAEQECVNRFYYLSGGTPAAATLSFLLTRGMGAVASAGVYPATGLMGRIAAIQSVAVSFVSLTVRDIYSDTDFYSLPFVEPLNGLLGTDGLSPVAAIGFRTNRVRRDVRRATKRFVGVVESITESTGILSGTFVAGAGAALATALGAIISVDDEGNTVTFSPVVLGKQRYNPDTQLPDPNGRAYRPYPTEAQQLAEIAQGIIWDIYPDVRSQTSRQRGRGR